MTQSRGIRAPRRAWSDFELEVLRQHYPNTLTRDLAELLGRVESTVHAKAARLGVKKSAEWLAGPMGQRLDGHRGHGHRFQPGQQPWCAGTKGVVGVQPGCRATQFKPGRPAHEARNYVPIGSLRVNHDGALERKMTDDPCLVPARRWTPVARLVWEAANGPIPEGHAVVFRAGRKTNIEDEITADRLECLSRAELARRNQASYPSELRSVVQLRGAITRQINRRLKETTP